MEEDPDTTDWQPGQAPPWLASYGQPQPDQVAAVEYPIATGPSVPGPNPPPPPPPPAPAPSTTSKGDGPIVPPPSVVPGLGNPFGISQLAGGVNPPDETAAPQQAAFTPPWLQSMNAVGMQAAPTVQPAAPMPAANPNDWSQAGLAAPPAEIDQANAKLAQTAMDPNASLDDRQKAWQSIPREQQTKLINTADPNQLAAIATSTMPQDDLATIAIRHQQAQIHEQSAQQLELMQKRDQDARRDYAAYQAVNQKADADTAQLSADAQKLSQTKIDPKEHGIGHFIASVLVGAAGGAMSKYTGGRNLALEELDKTTANRIEAQKADIANQWQGLGFKRNMIAEGVQRHGDAYRAAVEYHVQTYDRAIGELQTKMQDYDPQGTTALRIAGTLQQAQAQRQATLVAYHQQQTKNDLEQYKANSERLGKIEETRHNKAQEGIEWSKFGLEQTKAKTEGQVFQPAELQALHPGLPTPPIQMSLKDYGSWLERQKTGTELQGGQTKNQVEEAKGSVAAPTQTGISDEGTALVKTGKLVNKDGSTWRPPEKFEPMLAATDNVNRLSNKLSREIAEWGGQSDIKKSPRWQTIKGDYQDLVFALHGAKGIEGFRPGTAEQLHELTGDVDPTSFFRDARAGILNARDNVNDDLNSAATHANYDGPPITFPDTSHPAPPKETDIDRLGTQAQTYSIDRENPVDNEYLLRMTRGAKAVGGEEPSPEMAHALQLGIPPRTLDALQKLADASTGKDEKVAAAARAQLENIAKTNSDNAIRSFAGMLISPDISSLPVAAP